MENTKLIPDILDVYPEKAQYLYNEMVNIVIEAVNPHTQEITANIRMSILHLDEIVFQSDTVEYLQPGIVQNIVLAFNSLAESKGYGVDITLVLDDEMIPIKSTAFDVVSSWREAPRYGFLTNFYPKDENDDEDIKTMRKYHLNIVQFYDWMYKHDDLIPHEAYYIDPLERRLSLKAVRNKLELCHKYGMKAFAYGAVYAASKKFYEAHKDWALYDNSGNVQSLGNWLIIMNIAPESPWTKHIIHEFAKAIGILGFDGIHMDTYGFPKTAFSIHNGERKLERLDKGLPLFINYARKELEKIKEEVGILFNAVNGWPVNTVAIAEQDAVYIEVWDPNERYYSLYQMINRGREIGKKPVILAAYLKAFADDAVETTAAENCFMLTSAVIFSSGGYHILLGDGNGLLSEEYFVNHSKISVSFESIVRTYYDFIVRYSNLLYDPRLFELSMTHANGRNGEFTFENGMFSSYGEPDKIWTIIKERPGYIIINLINLTGIQSDIWNEGKGKKPITVENICINALIDENVRKVMVASPDFNSGISKELEFTYCSGYSGKYIKFTVPEIAIWSMIYIETDLPC